MRLSGSPGLTPPVFLSWPAGVHPDERRDDPRSQPGPRRGSHRPERAERNIFRIQKYLGV